MPGEGADPKAKCLKKQKGGYFPRNPEESSKNVPKPLRAAGVINKATRKKPTYEHTKSQDSLIFISFKFTCVTFSRIDFSLQTVILLYVYVLIKLYCRKWKAFVSSKENILLSGKGGTTPPQSPGNLGSPPQ